MKEDFVRFMRKELGPRTLLIACGLPASYKTETTEVIAQNIQMLGGRGEVDSSTPSPPGGDSGRTVEPEPGGYTDYDSGSGGGEDDSDLPF